MSEPRGDYGCANEIKLEDFLAGYHYVPSEPKQPKRKTGRSHRDLEWQHQSKVIEWADSLVESGERPELAFLRASLNGLYMPIGQAMKAKRGGMRAGEPDLELAAPRGGYHGIYIEMKEPGNKPSELQEVWIKQLREWGYYVAVCYSPEAAKSELVDYLDGKKVKGA